MEEITVKKSKTETCHIISCLIINARGPIITIREGSGYAKEYKRELVSDNDGSESYTIRIV